MTMWFLLLKLALKFLVSRKNTVLEPVSKPRYQNCILSLDCIKKKKKKKKCASAPLATDAHYSFTVTCKVNFAFLKNGRSKLEML